MIKFTRFEVWELVVPCRAEVLDAGPAVGGFSGNLTWPADPVYLVQGELEDGTVCVGESCRGEPAERVEKTLRRLLKEDLSLWHPATWLTATHRPDGLPSRYPLATYEAHGSEISFMLVESLWHDAVGKRAGVPAHALMGGAVREDVAVDFWANRPAAAPLLRLVDEAESLGLTGIKLKSDRTGDTARTLAEVAADFPGGFRVTIDPMCAWRSFRESAPIFQMLAGSGIPVSVEDPFAHGDDHEWEAAARAFPGLTLIYHARTMESLAHGIRAGVADAFNCGGIVEHDFLRLAAATAFHRKDCWHASTIELGVLQALHLHGAACASNCVLPSDLCSEWVREHTLVTPRMQFRNGRAVVPAEPGLGVAIDTDAAAHYARKKWMIRDD